MNYLKTEKLNFIGANSPQEIKYTIGIALEKSFGENGMNVACGMEMSISPKLCGAEVYACNAGKMKCWFGRGTKPTGTNGDEMERIYRKHTENQLDIFLFTAQLMGGGEIEEIAQSAELLTSCLERSLTTVPIF